MTSVTDQATQVAGTATNAATDVAGTAKEQAAHVVGEALNQTQDLLGHAGQQINAQAGEQTQRLAGNIRQLAEHFATMAGAGERGTTAHTVVDRAAAHADNVAGYLEGKQPGELVNDVQNLGRRRPLAFLFGAALAGVAVGRLASGAKKPSPQSATQRSTSPTSTTPSSAPVTSPVPIRNVAPGAATVEPYPTAAASPTTPPAGSW